MKTISKLTFALLAVAFVTTAFAQDVNGSRKQHDPQDKQQAKTVSGSQKNIDYSDIEALAKNNYKDLFDAAKRGEVQPIKDFLRGEENARGFWCKVRDCLSTCGTYSSLLPKITDNDGNNILHFITKTEQFLLIRNILRYNGPVYGSDIDLESGTKKLLNATNKKGQIPADVKHEENNMELKKVYEDFGKVKTAEVSNPDATTRYIQEKLEEMYADFAKEQQDKGAASNLGLSYNAFFGG